MNESQVVEIAKKSSSTIWLNQLAHFAFHEDSAKGPLKMCLRNIPCYHMSCFHTVTVLTRSLFYFLLALQKIRQASLLEELREACAKKVEKSDYLPPSIAPAPHGSSTPGGASKGVNSLLACAAESQDPPKLPPSFILNLVKSELLRASRSKCISSYSCRYCKIVCLHSELVCYYFTSTCSTCTEMVRNLRSFIYLFIVDGLLNCFRRNGKNMQSF